MIKMIVVDLDGTILNSNRKVTEVTKKYFKMLQSKGYIIVAATGRTYSSALRGTDGASFIDFIISDTGTCAFEVKDNSTIFQHEISKDTAKKILSNYNESYRVINLCYKDKMYRYPNDVINFIEKVDKINNILNNFTTIYHISIQMKNNAMVLELYNKMIKEYKDLNILIMQDSFGEDKWLEILPNGCSKVNGIKTLANYLNITNEDIICFGDGLNDVEMLQKCGYGVAMKNALEEVKKAAKDTTKSDNNNDGVINYLKDILKIN